MLNETFFPSTEEVISTEPLTIRRVVRWSECDPAGVAFTPKFLEYAVSAQEALISLLLGGKIHTRKRELGIDFPMRGAELDFRSPLHLDATFEMIVTVLELRSRAVTWHLIVRLRRFSKGWALNLRL